MQVIVIGTDVPDLTAEVIVQANVELNVHDISLGPAEDGGYYLIAMHRPHEALFRDIQWSTPTVFAATQAAAIAEKLRFAQETSLPKLRDIDFIEVRTVIAYWISTDYNMQRPEVSIKPHTRVCCPLTPTRIVPLFCSRRCDSQRCMQDLATWVRHHQGTSQERHLMWKSASAVVTRH